MCLINVTEKCVMKRKFKFESYKNSLVTQLENKINYLEKNEINKNSLKSYKEFTRNNKLILNTRQRFSSERRNAFIE